MTGRRKAGLTPRQEAFCRAFVEVPVAARAAAEAGYSRRSARTQGWRLLARPMVRDRIRVLRGELVAAHAESRSDLLAKAESVFRRAMEDHNYQAAGRALALQARLAGMVGEGTGAVAVAALGLDLSAALGDSPGAGRVVSGASEKDDLCRPMLTDATAGSSFVDMEVLHGIKGLAGRGSGKDDG